LFLDEFSELCDIVLPDTHFLEALFPSAHQEVGFNGPTGMTDWYVGIQQPVVPPSSSGARPWKFTWSSPGASARSV